MGVKGGEMQRMMVVRGLFPLLCLFVAFRLPVNINRLSFQFLNLMLQTNLERWEISLWERWMKRVCRWSDGKMW